MSNNLAFLLYLEKKRKENDTISLKDCIESFQKKHPNFEIINSDTILIHLYGSIVLPWERLKKKLPKKIMMSTINHDEWGYFKILNYNPSYPIQKMDLRFFIRKLRNAISHNNVKISEQLSIVFKNSDGTTIQFEWEELLKLMHQLNRL